MPYAKDTILILSFLSESALAVLLPSFAFDLPTDYEIVWRSGITLSPSVKGEKGYNATMPMRVKRLDGHAA